MKKQKIAVVGFGMWGKNIVRNFYNLNVLDIVCDLDVEVHKTIQEQFPGVRVTNDINEIISQNADIIYANDAHKDEHSIEVQLPFLQKSLKDFNCISKKSG